MNCLDKKCLDKKKNNYFYMKLSKKFGSFIFFYYICNRFKKYIDYGFTKV